MLEIKTVEDGQNDQPVTKKHTIQEKKIWIDCETSGVDPSKNGIWQLSYIIEIEGKETERNKLYSVIDKPKIWDDVARRMAGDEYLSINCKSNFHKLYAAFKHVLVKYIDPYNKYDKFLMYGYNSRFDYDFIRDLFNMEGDKFFGSFIAFPPIDVMNLAADYIGFKRFKLINFKLGTVAQYFDIDFNPDDLHDSYIDIDLTKKIYAAIKQRQNNLKIEGN